MGCWGFRTRLLALAVLLVVPGCGLRSTAASLYPDVAEHAGKRVDKVRFEGTEPFRSDSLIKLISTQPSRCSFLGLPICVPFTRIGRQEHQLSLRRVTDDVETLERFYRVAGYFGTQVEPRVDPVGDDDVNVTFRVNRGDPVVLDVLTVTGTEGLLDPDSLARTLPLQPGNIFHLGRFIESSDRVLAVLQRRGHAFAEVLRSFTVDTIDNRAEATIDAAPGPQVRVDSIIVRGADHMSRPSVLRQLEIREGDLLRSAALVNSQRNLYALDLVSLASVTIAEDSLQVTPEDSTRATVVVRISEAPVHEVEAAVGFGTEECLRTEGQWMSRSFRGGARRLSVRGSLTRLGVGEPFAISAGERVCPAVPGDTVFGGSRFDYRLSADFSQPYFINPRNQLGINAYAERLAEPGVFQRQAVGARGAVTRRLGARSGGSAGVEVERGRTVASPALFCAAFLVCEPATIDSLSQARFRAELGANYFMDAANNRLNPTAGYVTRTGVAWASRLLGSQINFFRWTGDAAFYREVRPSYVLATAVRFGNFFRTITVNPEDNFLPPEDRFYAGGATSVRGFERNALGPGVYVTDSDSIRIVNGDTTLHRNPRFVPTGGTALAVTSVELRMPSPFLRERLRLALFVDAGAVGTRSLWDLSWSDWRVTPGLGLRMQTPVGPVRVDLGFNPYDEPTAPLLVTDTETGRLRRIGVYQADAGTIFNRMRLHLGVGHAF